MTIVEFYDKTSIENIAGTLLCTPANMILIGNNKKHLEKSCLYYKKVLEKRNINTALSYRSVNKNNLQDIVELLSDIVENNEKCVFDVTGGEDLYLVAVGIILERYGERVQCHRFNLRSSTVTDCDNDGKVCGAQDFDISIEENISIYEGDIVTESEGDIFTYEWDFNEEFVADIEAMWELCKADARKWNAQIGTLGNLADMFPCENELDFSVAREDAARALKNIGVKFALDSAILRALEKRGLIYALVVGENISFTFKNLQVKRSLTIAGQVLELFIADRLRGAKDKDGSNLYHDVKVGVVLDWDGDDESDTIRTINEIDIIAMKGAIPVFISCKNGDFDMEELYKLNSVAARFGNDYAKKVLVTTELEKLGYKADFLRERMEDMGIRCVENVDEMSVPELERILKSLWSN